MRLILFIIDLLFIVAFVFLVKGVFLAGKESGSKKKKKEGVKK